MKTIHELRAFTDRVDHGIDGAYWDLSVGNLGKRLAFAHGLPEGERDILFVRIQRIARDNRNPHAKPSLWPGRWWVILPQDTESQVANTLLKAVLTYVEHEARERFTLDGEPLYEPNH